jgi:hypothetical protein
MKRYSRKVNEGSRYEPNERNDCSVLAIAIAARMKYKDAHELCASAGRRTGHRFHAMRAVNKLAAEGYCVESVGNLVQKNGSAYTPKTIGNKLKRGYYMCWIRGHVFAVVNGEVEDWTNNRKHRITKAVKITKPRNN